jgi:hypothetical protein
MNNFPVRPLQLPSELSAVFADCSVFAVRDLHTKLWLYRATHESPACLSATPGIFLSRRQARATMSAFYKRLTQEYKELGTAAPVHNFQLVTLALSPNGVELIFPGDFNVWPADPSKGAPVA